MPRLVPRPRTPLVGRSAERETIRRLLLEQGVRLLTLSGAGGTGKTRLALQVAFDLADDFDSRVYFVSLASITETELVVPEIARAVGARGGRAPLQAVVAELAASPDPTLLILDNFEQVIGAAGAIGEVLDAVPLLSVLVTSREVLRVYGEHDVPVEPLEFPAGGSMPAPVELIERYPAVALFVERARAANPSFVLTPQAAPTVVELCARLDGLPLALELAAARVRMLSPEAMLARLQSRLQLATRGARDLPDRQQTLSGALDWSHELIDEPERVLFRRLGAFVGGFTLEAAEAVADTYGTLGLDIVEGVSSLVDKSLVRRDDRDHRDDEEPRFTMLETIREYAADKLAQSDDVGIRRAHAAYYLVLAEEGSRQSAQADDPRWLERCARENDNFRAALEWLTEQGEAEWGLRLALALFHFWDRADQLSEGRRRYAALLDLEDSHRHKRLRARALFSAGVLTASQGERSEACRLQMLSLALCRQLDDRRGMAVALNGLCINQTELRQYAQAARYADEALALWKELGDDIGYARSLSNGAFVAKLHGDPERARAMYGKAVELFESAGDAIGAAWAINHQADVVLEQGDLDAAAALYEQAWRRFTALGHAWGVATTLADKGSVLLRRGEVDGAVALYRDSLKSFATLDHKRGIARLLEALGCAAAEQRQADRGLRLIAAAAALRERIGTPVPDIERGALERYTARMREALGADAEKVWDEGARSPLSEAIERAIR